MKRRHDWPEQLAAHLHAARLEKFGWGWFDCCIFPADGVLRMTDTDIAADLRGYTDGPGALRALKRFAGGTLPQAMERIAANHKLIRVRTNDMQRGDLAMVNAEDFAADPAFGGILALCMGPMIAIASEQGLVYIPKAAVRVAWHIP